MLGLKKAIFVTRLRDAYGTEERPEGISIRSSAAGARPDPYYVAAQLMSALLELAGRHIDQTELEPGLAEVRAELERLRTAGGGM
jgi:hypothetical protein